MMHAETHTIQQMAAATGLSVHTLRYYERIGLLNPIARDSSSGHRRYSHTDIVWIGFLKHLRATGMPLRQIHQYAVLLREGSATVGARQLLLEEHQATIEAHLAEVQQHLAAISNKIALYKQFHTLETAESAAVGALKETSA
jgi:DNA-binding transcriptional MerR regulator